MHLQQLQQGIMDNQDLVTLVSDAAGRLVIKVLDMEGRIARTLVANIEAGRQQIELQLSDLNSGKYVLNAFNGDVFLKSISFIKP